MLKSGIVLHMSNKQNLQKDNVHRNNKFTDAIPNNNNIILISS